MGREWRRGGIFNTFFVWERTFFAQRIFGGAELDEDDDESNRCCQTSYFFEGETAHPESSPLPPPPLFWRLLRQETVKLHVWGRETIKDGDTFVGKLGKEHSILVFVGMETLREDIFFHFVRWIRGGRAHDVGCSVGVTFFTVREGGVYEVHSFSALETKEASTEGVLFFLWEQPKTFNSNFISLLTQFPPKVSVFSPSFPSTSLSLVSSEIRYFGSA